MISCTFKWNLLLLVVLPYHLSCTQRDISRFPVIMNSLLLWRKIVLFCNFCDSCGHHFCAVHRYAEAHGCTFDYKAEGRKILEQSNPVVTAPKLPKIWVLFPPSPHHRHDLRRLIFVLASDWRTASQLLRDISVNVPKIISLLCNNTTLCKNCSRSVIISP